MHRKKNLFQTLFVFLVVSVILFALSLFGFLKPVRGVFELLISPFQRTITKVSTRVSTSFQNDRLEKLEKEKRILAKQLVDWVNLQKENNALKDQFQTSLGISLNLLPAKVIGAPSFIPHVTSLETLILDKGQQDGVQEEMGVVFEGNAVGKITKTSQRLSIVMLVTNKEYWAPAKTVQTSALGVLKGKGNSEMVIDNVLLSEKLNTSDTIVTALGINTKGIGMPPDFIFGEITASEKKPSDLFQKAQVKSILDFTKLSTVFIVLGEK